MESRFASKKNMEPRLSFIHLRLGNIYPGRIRDKQTILIVILLLMFKIIFTVMLRLIINA
jgi:hypothetical protein